MKINNVQINGFGNIKEKNLNFENGINLIYGENETGKSTLANFLKAIFYGVNRNKNGNAFSEYERFKPWGESEFSGKIEYEVEGKEFTAVRDFNRNNCKVFDKEGNEITALFNKDKMRGTEIGIEQLEIDEETFINSIFVSQKNVEVDEVGRKSVIQKLTNMIQTGDEATSYEKAKQKLQKKLLDEIGSDRTQNKPLNVTMREINLLEDKKANLIQNREKQTIILEKEKELDKKLVNTENDFEKTSKVLEIKDRYFNLLRERENDYEIAVKIAEKEYQKRIEIKKKTKKDSQILTVILASIIVIACIVLKWYIPAGIVAVVGIITSIILANLLSMDVKMGTVPNFDAIREDFKKKENRELELLKKDGIKESLITRKIPELKSLMDGLKKSKDDLILEKHKLKIEMEGLKENLDRLNELEERLNELYEKEEKLRKLEYSIKLAISKLDEAYIELKEEVVPKFENEIKESIRKTTNNEYQKILYNDEQGILIENYLGDLVTLDKLSVGTIDQIYLGFRLAIANKTAKLPLILDEAFAFYDNERLENILKIFAEEYSERQIIILTCSDREKEILDNLNAKYNLINM